MLQNLYFSAFNVILVYVWYVHIFLRITNGDVVISYNQISYDKNSYQ